MQLPRFLLIKAMQTQHVGDAFGLGDWTARRKDGHDGTANLDVGCAAKGFECKLRKIRTQADFAFPVGHDRFAV